MSIELATGLAYAWYSLGYVEHAMSLQRTGSAARDDLVAAREHAETGISLDPYDAYGKTCQGLIHSRLGRREEALEGSRRSTARSS